MKIGIVSFQGSVEEHESSLKKLEKEIKRKIEVRRIKRESELSELSGIIIPGGESTVISKFLIESGIAEKIKSLSLPIFGTCAGAIALAKRIAGESKGYENPLKLIDMKVERNAYGRQVDSFEAELRIKFFDSPFRGVFIRAPRIVEIGKGAEVLSELHGNAVMVKQKNALATVFHPELTDDVRVHKYFVEELCAE